MTLPNKKTYHQRIAGNNPESILPEEVCRDLNMEDLFEGLDFTSSCVGRQYLYHLLCTDKVSEVGEHEKIVSQLSANAGMRKKLTDALKPLNNPDAYSIAELLAEDHRAYSPRYLRLLQVCRWLPSLFAALVFIVPSSPVPFLLLVAAYIGNAALHFREKNKSLGYFFSIPQLRKLLLVAETLSKEAAFQETDREIVQTIGRLEGLKRKLGTFRFGLKLEGDGAALVYLFSEFLNIFFLAASLNIITSFIALADKKADILRVFRFVGRLDALCSVSRLREELPHWCHPTHASGRDLQAEGIYHPLIKDCIPNDLTLAGRSMLLTGSNMSGKTSFIRTIAVNLIASKALNTCFARRFAIDLSLRLYSVIHTEDDLTEGKSYFFKEAENVRNALLRGEGGNRLLIFDELFKGTNTVERIAINAAVFSALAARGNIVLASTHDLKLADLLAERYDLYHFCESISDGRLSFDYTLKPGVVKEGNAIKILQLCDYPKEIIETANALSGQFARH